MRRPNFLHGALVGLLLTAPLVIVSALANQLAGLPFAAYDLFPFVRDLIPGPLITFGIDTMVNTLLALKVGRLDEAAKTAEQAMAIVMLIGLGMIAGAVFFALMRGITLRRAYLAGLVLGLVVGLPMVYLSQNVGLSARLESPIVNALWTLALFGVWGVLHGWAYVRLSVAEVAPAAHGALVYENQE